MPVTKQPPPSRLSSGARRILASTKAARAAIDRAIAGVIVAGGPPELGAPRDLDIDDVRRRYAERQR